jgi:hypothetical protein
LEWTLVAVKWEDVTSLARFSLAQDFDANRLYKMSVGFVVKETDEYVVIADDLDMNLDADSCNNYGTLIPRGCIREWRVIRSFELPQRSQALAAAGKEDGKRGQAARSPRTVDELVRAHPSLLASAEEVAARLGIDLGDARAELEALEQRGAVARIGSAEVPIYVFRGE